jgi:superfamily II DNA or RNA helicase
MNAPETTVAVIASSTASVRQRIQRLGRVLRPAPGKTHATVYTIYATASEEQRLRKEENGLHGVASVAWLKSSSKRHGKNPVPE